MKKGHLFFVLLVLFTLALVVFYNGRFVILSRLRYAADLKARKPIDLNMRDLLDIAKRPWFSLNTSQQQILPKNYMLAFFYPEQLTMSILHFGQLLNLAGGWNFTGVEPYVTRSSAFGVRLWDNPSQEYVKFSFLFNASTMNNEMANCMNKSSVFEPMSEFLNHSYRNITTVFFNKHWSVLSRSVSNAVDNNVKFDKEPIVDCTATAREKGLSESVEDRLNKELQSWNDEEHEARSTDKQPFRVVQTFCVHKTLPLTLIQMMDYIDQHIKQRVGPNGIRKRLTSLVFFSWQGHFQREFGDRTPMDKCRLPVGEVIRSNLVKQTALRFVESLGLQKNSFLSIHIRFEKVFEWAPKKNTKSFLQCVVNQLNTLINEARKAHNLSSNAVLLMTDYGTYGSDTCAHKGSKKTCTKEANKLLSSIAVPKTEFDPKKFGMPRNSGFVSLVESESLLLGKALITAGRGSYQQAIVDLFQQIHGSEFLYRVGGSTSNPVCD